MVTVSEYFEVVYGVNLELSNLELDPIGINFVSRTAKNNGVSAKVKLILEVNPNPPNTISVSGGGSVMESFLQKEPYYSGRDLFYLKPKLNFDDKQLLFYCMCLRANKYRFSYGRQANKTLEEILIPSISEIPNWVREIRIPTRPSKKALINKIFKLNTTNWKYFRYENLFTIERGRGIRIKDIIDGHTPFVTSIDSNNGISAYVDSKPLHKKNTITVNRNGSVAEAFFQSKAFCSTEDVHIFNPKFKINKYVAFFLITLIRMERYRYSYGRKWGIERMNESLIKLPITKQDDPDFVFMENFIKSLPYSASL